MRPPPPVWEGWDKARTGSRTLNLFEDGEEGLDYWVATFFFFFVSGLGLHRWFVEFMSLEVWTQEVKEIIWRVCLMSCGSDDG